MLLGLWDYYNLLAQCIPLSLHAGKAFDKVEWSVFNQVNFSKVFQGYRSAKWVLKSSGLDTFSKKKLLPKRKWNISEVHSCFESYISFHFLYLMVSSEVIVAKIQHFFTKLLMSVWAIYIVNSITLRMCIIKGFFNTGMWAETIL